MNGGQLVTSRLEASSGLIDLLTCGLCVNVGYGPREGKKGEALVFGPD